MKVPHSGVWIQSGEQLDGRVCPSHYQPTQSMKQHHSDFSYPTNKGNFISFKHLLVSICKIWTLVWIALYHLDNLVYVHLNEYFISWVLVEKKQLWDTQFQCLYSTEWTYQLLVPGRLRRLIVVFCGTQIPRLFVTFHPWKFYIHFTQPLEVQW